MKLVKYLDHFVFKYCVDNLHNAKTPDEIANFYVSKFVFGNPNYLKAIMSDYHLPNDFLKLHQRVVALAGAPYQEVK